MKSVVGVFKSRSDAEEGAAELVPLQIPRDRITILAPHASDQEIAAVERRVLHRRGVLYARHQPAGRKRRASQRLAVRNFGYGPERSFS